MSEQKIVFLGVIASSSYFKVLDIFTGFLAVESGKITQKGSKSEFEALEKTGTFNDYKKIFLDKNQLLMPGFVDCHTHAPQFPNIGLGLDRSLLEWLAKYTFPLESKYGDLKFAENVYSQVVQRLLKNGTTTACYFGSLHLEGTLELVKSVIKHHQRALVGKVSMNIKNDAGYFNNTQRELAQVTTFVEKVIDLKNDLVQPVVTPRFALSCDEELMTGLARISEKYGCAIQSHISENLKEIEFVLQQNPDCKSYAQVYDKSSILNNRCIMAHAIHLTNEEIALMSSKGVSIAHCPASNTRLKSGLCPVRKYLNHNMKLGLGTDVSGGDSASILDAIRRSLDVSTYLEMQGTNDCSIDWKEAFYLATLGGARALNLDHKIGNFEIGKEFDALLIDVYANGQTDRYPDTVDVNSEDYAIELMQRFIYLADDRNIVQVYVKGKIVKDITSTLSK